MGAAAGSITKNEKNVRKRISKGEATDPSREGEATDPYNENNCKLEKVRERLVKNVLRRNSKGEATDPSQRAKKTEGSLAEKSGQQNELISNFKLHIAEPHLTTLISRLTRSKTNSASKLIYSAINVIELRIIRKKLQSFIKQKQEPHLLFITLQI